MYFNTVWDRMQPHQPRVTQTTDSSIAWFMMYDLHELRGLSPRAKYIRTLSITVFFLEELVILLADMEQLFWLVSRHFAIQVELRPCCNSFRWINPQGVKIGSKTK
jgi:hypothetical protein